VNQQPQTTLSEPRGLAVTFTTTSVAISVTQVAKVKGRGRGIFTKPRNSLVIVLLNLVSR
jgi:hypothetical protein